MIRVVAGAAAIAIAAQYPIHLSLDMNIDTGRRRRKQGHRGRFIRRIHRTHRQCVQSDVVYISLHHSFASAEPPPSRRRPTAPAAVALGAAAILSISLACSRRTWASKSSSSTVAVSMWLLKRNSDLRATKRTLFSELSWCLSRACLGNRSVFV
jgi:hypothetical protein